MPRIKMERLANRFVHNVNMVVVLDQTFVNVNQVSLDPLVI